MNLLFSRLGGNVSEGARGVLPQKGASSRNTFTVLDIAYELPSAVDMGDDADGIMAGVSSG
ncbi:hypothetical protein ABZ953_16810 [Streptomyces sp. NPDC046465]|uniref:hypothetical protein n=1 Tax=Streptomyces sp. NPDC046465 TaxID=3155810 RepID=UPI003400E286